MVDDELKADVVGAFADFRIMKMPTSFGEIQILSIHELPIHYMMKIGLMADNDKMPELLGLIEKCIVDPEDWEKFQSLNTREVVKFIGKWMKDSNSEAEAEDLDGGDIDES